MLPQALIAGKPVVSYDIDGYGRSDIAGRTGFLIPPRDVSALAQAIITLAGDAEFARDSAAKDSDCLPINFGIKR